MKLDALYTLFRPGVSIINFASWIHITWAICLLQLPLKTTGLALSLSILQSNVLAGCVYLFAGMLATVAVLSSFKSSWTNIWLLMPQQFLLFISAITAVKSIFLGQFADNVLRSSWFILADQVWMPYLCLFHAIATLTSFVFVKKFEVILT